MSAKNPTNFQHVEMVPAFLWTCPDCGRDNFERSVVVELSPEEMQELREDHGVEVWEQGEFLSCPKAVVCQHCRLKYKTAEYREEEAE